MNKLIILFAIAPIFHLTTASAQVYNWADGEKPFDPDSVQGLYVGLNLGYYFANKASAVMYGGYGFDRDGARLDFANSWLNIAIQGNPEFERRTSELIGVDRDQWQFTESDMPGEMRYSPSFMYGGHLRYMFNADFGVFAEINGTNPVTVSQFTIQTFVQNPNPAFNEPLRTFQIRGEEQRLMIQLGIHRVLGRKARERQGRSGALMPYFDLGFNTTFVKFEENFISLNDNFPPIDLTVFFNQQGLFVDEARVLTGVGIGGFGSLGGQLQIGSKFTINMGYMASLEQIKLGEFNQRNFQHILMLRAIYLTF